MSAKDPSEKASLFNEFFSTVFSAKTMDSKETGLETFITWVVFSSPIGCFVLQDGVCCFYHSGNL